MRACDPDVSVGGFTDTGTLPQIVRPIATPGKRESDRRPQALSNGNTGVSQDRQQPRQRDGKIL
jgi:hypothetical protein